MSQLYSKEDFWHYSLSFYKVTVHKNTLLWLQDNTATNVNLILAILYIANKGQLVSEAQAKAIYACIKSLDYETKVVRKKRRQILPTGQSNNIFTACSVAEKEQQMAYKMALAAELELEKKQQAEMVQWMQRHQRLVVNKYSKEKLEDLLIGIVNNNLDCPNLAQSLDLDCPNSFKPAFKQELAGHIKVLLNEL